MGSFRADQLFLVEAGIKYNSWENSGSAIDCQTTSRYSSRNIDIGQWCTTIGSANSSACDGWLFEAAFEFAHSYGMDWSAMCTSTSAVNYAARVCTYKTKASSFQFSLQMIYNALCTFDFTGVQQQAKTKDG
ncbi:hypothetical protein F4821DRAFT_265094 [Hypoxylon rubiginosum]|uniref:Uncharacterized protein n=1 Tax=Hypoxylon rubiginosum TaxID=110542 RepID=A0ACC0CLE9_9PEZI|nr:hypothetical protein F4821DRAFT_265094 [Hypoxylon rubiginosum]